MTVLLQVAVVSSFLIALYFSIVLIFHNVLADYNSHGSFQFRAVTNHPAMGTSLCGQLYSFGLSVHSGVEMLGQRMCVLQNDCAIYIPTSSL